jgi:WS/DGAT/MGAT family acyltransferase
VGTGPEKLSGLDRSFLALESAAAHMHIGATLVFAGGSLIRGRGAVDVERVRAYTAARLHLLPRYRQRLGKMPIGPDLFWIDDPAFDVRRHVLSARLPAPGGEAELKEFAARVASEPLDRSRALWELWVVEGLAGDRFALVTKIHHCLTDGVAAVDLLAALLSPAVVEKPEPAPAWEPRPVPGSLRLWADALRDQASRPVRAARALGRALGARSAGAEALRHELEAVGETLASVRPTSRTRLNQPIGAKRRVEWLALELEALREMRARLGGTLNDAVLAITAGALRAYLAVHGERVAALDLRALVPVSVRSPTAHGEVGNQIALWLVDLPVEESDPRLRHEQVCAVTRSLKRSSQTQGAAALARVTAWTSTALLARAARLIPRARPFNLLVTNVPGPQIPLWLLDGRLEAAYPLAPLFRDQVLGIALFSYAGRLHWGLNADRACVPDLALFRDCVLRASEELQAAARAS